MPEIHFSIFSFTSGKFFRVWMRNRTFSAFVIANIIKSLLYLTFYALTARGYDVILIHRRITPLFPAFFNRLFSWSKVPIIYDMDDAIFTEYNIVEVLRAARVVTVGNRYLERYVRSVAPDAQVLVLPTVVDTHFYQPALHKENAKVRVGWIGTGASFKRYMQPMLAQITALCLKQDAEFWVIASRDVQEVVEQHGANFSEWSLEGYLETLQKLDIGIMPLIDDDYVRGKCAFKLIEYGAVGIASVGTRIGANEEVIDDGITGFLASSDAEFLFQVRTLIRDPDLRQTMGRAARERVVKHYSIEKQVEVMREIFQRVASKGQS